MNFGMKSNDITKDRLEYYASGRSMATELIVTDGMEDGASCPTFPRSGGLASNYGLCRKPTWSRFPASVTSSLKFEMANKIMSHAISLNDLLIARTRNQLISIKQGFEPNY